MICKVVFFSYEEVLHPTNNVNVTRTIIFKTFAIKRSTRFQTKFLKPYV